MVGAKGGPGSETTAAAGCGCGAGGAGAGVESTGAGAAGGSGRGTVGRSAGAGGHARGRVVVVVVVDILHRRWKVAKKQQRLQTAVVEGEGGEVGNCAADAGVAAAGTAVGSRTEAACCTSVANECDEIYTFILLF